MNFNITLRKCFDIAGLPQPNSFTELLDEPIAEFAVNNNWLPIKARKEGLRVLVGFTFENTKRDNYLRLINEGVVVITYEPIYDENGNLVKMILLSSFYDVRKLWLSLGNYIRNLFPIPAIAVTGSLGKTTTCSLLELIFAKKYKIFSTKGNLNNTEYIVREMARYYDKTYTMHIQEIGGGVIGSVERVANMIKPDMFVITTILPHHMNYYLTFENVEKDKTSLDRCAKDGAIGVINIDNDALRSHEFVHRVVTCGIAHREADYVAENIRYEGNYLKLDIRHNGEIAQAEVRIPGKHNAYNILLAFAAAKEYGIETDTILCGLKEYKSGFIRQNLTNISGRTMLIDCFNHAVDSIKAALEFAQETSVPEGCRKIAVLGGENALGNESFSVNFELGLSLAEYDTIDEFVFFGCPDGTSFDAMDKVGNSMAVFEGAKRVLRGRKLSYCSSREQVADKLIHETRPGDLIVLKGIMHYPLWPAVDIAFGTALTMRSGTVIVTRKVANSNADGVFMNT